MTPRTPQCEVFWPFNSSFEFSGVPEDSKFPLLGVWASPSHLAQSGVATHELGEMFDEVVEVAKKKKENMEEVPQPIVQSMANVGQFSIQLESRKHLEVNFHMESAMEQMINQMNQLNFHLL
jgi:hypothetical protein